MDYVQALFSFFIAPLFGTVMLGMLWKRATPAGGFWGLLAGTVSSIGMWAWVKARSQRACVCRALAARQGHGGEHVPRAVVVDHLRRGHGGGQHGDQAEAGQRAAGLVYGCTEIPSEGAPAAVCSGRIFWAGVCAVVFVDPQHHFLVGDDMHGRRNMISIWFFIGVLLLVYGFLITGAGLYELMSPPANTVVLAELHAGIWWGALLLVIGLLYSLSFRPGRTLMAV